MGGAPGFLGTSSEVEDFARVGRRIRRAVVELGGESGEGQSVDTGELLEEVVENALRAETGAASRTWRCICTEVAEDDGMTWSAEEARRAAGHAAPHFQQICLPQTKREDRLPQIATWVGKTKLLRLAVEHKLTTEFVTLRSWVTPVLVAGIVLLTGLLEVWKRVANTQAKETGGSFASLAHPAFWLQTAALFVLGFAIKHLKSRLDTDSESKSCKNFVKQLTDVAEFRTYPQFVQALAEELARTHFPRVVVVDEFEGQDPVTRDVIREYFQHGRKQATGSELWIIFEKEDGERVGALLRGDARAEDRPYIRLYKQLFVTREEKKSLVKLLELQPEAEEYTTVRSICRRDGKGAEAVKRFLKEYRKGHQPEKRQYDALQILHLLALTASPGQAMFEVKKLSAEMLQTKTLRFDVLCDFLGTEKIFKHELEKTFDEMKPFPSDVVIWDNAERALDCRATRETQDYLAKNGGQRELRLPDGGTGHLYWAFFYFDELQNHALEAFWVRKLIYHLEKASTKGVNARPHYAKLVQQLFEVHLFAVTAGMSACLFKEIPTLLEHANDLVAADEAELGGKQRRRLLKLCWDVYSVLGDERILQIIFELYTPGPVEVVAESAGKEHTLTLFFADLLPLKSEQRGLLNDHFFRWIEKEYAGDDAVVDDCRARAAWFIFSLGPMLEPWKDSYLLDGLAHADREIAGLTQRAMTRLKDPRNVPPRLADAITVSLGLWCGALRQDSRTVQRSQFARTMETGDYQEALAAPVLLSLLKTCRHVVEEAATLREYREPGSTFAGNVLYGAMARELGVMALAAGQAGCALKLRRSLYDLEEEEYAELAGIARRCSEVFKFELGEFKSGKNLLGIELTEKTGALLRMCELVWQDFTLTRLHDFLNLRRVHFAAVAQGLPPAHFDEASPLVKSLVPLLGACSYSGVVANTVVAACLQETPQLSAFYLDRTATHARVGGLSELLQKELSLLALAKGHVFGYDLTPHLLGLMEEPPMPSRLDEFLENQSDEVVVGFVLAMMNTAIGSKPSELGRRVLERARRLAADERRGSETRAEILAIADVRELQLRMRQGEQVKAAEVLGSWEKRKEKMVYSTVLELLLANGYGNAEIEAEGVALLATHARRDAYTGFLTLSYELGRRLEGGEREKRELDEVTEFLQRSVRQWEGQITAPTTLMIYKLLSRLRPERKLDYLGHIVNAECIELRFKYVEWLPGLAQKGKYFTLFYDYWKSMQYWGLDCDWESDLQPQLNLDPSERQAMAAEWKERGAKVPHAVLGNKKVNGEFLVLGNALFGSSLDREQVYEGAREGFNQEARNAMPGLLSSIGGLKGLPESIRVLIDAHEKRMEGYTSIFSGGRKAGVRMAAG